MSNKPTPHLDQFCERTGAVLHSEKQTAEDGSRAVFWWIATDTHKSTKFASLNALESRVRADFVAMLRQFGVQP